VDGILVFNDRKQVGNTFTPQRFRNQRSEVDLQGDASGLIAVWLVSPP